MPRKAQKDSFLIIDLDDEEVKGTGTTMRLAMKDAEERADANCETLTDNRLVMAVIDCSLKVTSAPRLMIGEKFK